MNGFARAVAMLADVLQEKGAAVSVTNKAKDKAQAAKGKVKKAIKDWLSTLSNCWYFFPAAHGYGVNGIPDIVGCYRGVFFAIEVKAKGNIKGVTALQAMQIREINKAQGWACAADNVETVRELFHLIDLSLKEDA